MVLVLEVVANTLCTEGDRPAPSEEDADDGGATPYPLCTLEPVPGLLLVRTRDLLRERVCEGEAIGWVGCGGD